jgi:hypothetical protein
MFASMPTGTTKTTKTTAKKAVGPKVTTPWGGAAVADEVRVAQRVGDKRFMTVVQLLELEGGEILLRIAYTTDGVVRRGPVTLRARDLERLRAALEARPALAEALGLTGGGA